MYLSPPVNVSGSPFVIPNPRPASGAAPVAVQITNNSSYVCQIQTGAQLNYVDPYTRTTMAIETMTDSIPVNPIYQAYALVGAGYMSADWLLPNETPAQPDGALPISQLITQAIQTITSSDSSLTVTNPNGPTTDLKMAKGIQTITSTDGSIRVTTPSGPSTDLSVQTTIQQLLGIPAPVTTGGLQWYNDPLGQMWIAMPGVAGGAWKLAREALHARRYRSAGWSTSTSLTSMTWDTTTYDPYGLVGAGGFTTPFSGMWLVSLNMGCTPTAAGQWFLISINIGTAGAQIMHHSGLSGNLILNVNSQMSLGAGYNITGQFQSGVAVAGITGAQNTWMGIAYLGQA